MTNIWLNGTLALTLHKVKSRELSQTCIIKCIILQTILGLNFMPYQIHGQQLWIV